MQMRPSRVLSKLRAGKIVSCFKLNFSCGRVAELAAMNGFDCIWTDMEHTALDWDGVEKQIWAAKTQGTDVMVRVTRGSYSDYIRPFELDAAGIMVPHIMNTEDAKKVAWMTRFHPVGRRPIDGGNADGAYCNLPLKDYIKQANEQRFVVVQIEDPEPLDDVHEIASIEGIDMIFFGPGDFSHAIGAPGEMSHPTVVEWRKKIPQIAREHGKFSGTIGGLGNFSELVDMGYQFVNLGADVLGLNPYCQELIEAFQAKADKLGA